MFLRSIRSVLACQVRLNLEVPKFSCIKNHQGYMCRFSSNSNIVQMRGLDYDTKEEDVIGFFKPLGIVPKKVHLKWDGAGRTASISEVEFTTHADAVVAMRKKNAFLGNKFIRLTLKSMEANTDVPEKCETSDSQSSTKDTLNIEIKSDTSLPRGHFLHMKNAPWRLTDQAIYDFFWCVGAYVISVKPLYNDIGLRTGEFDVQFFSQEDVVKAIAKNNAYLGRKCVQLSLKCS